MSITRLKQYSSAVVATYERRYELLSGIGPLQDADHENSLVKILELFCALPYKLKPSLVLSPKWNTKVVQADDRFNDERNIVKRNARTVIIYDDAQNEATYEGPWYILAKTNYTPISINSMQFEFWSTIETLRMTKEVRIPEKYRATEVFSQFFIHLPKGS